MEFDAEGFVTNRRRLLKIAGVAAGGIGGFSIDTDVARADQTGAGRCEVVPLNVALALDRSGSMTDEPNKFQNSKEGAIGLVDQLTANDRAALISFADDVRRDVDLTDDLDRVSSSIRGLTAGGGTDIAGAVATGQRLLLDGASDDATTILIVLSDGNQTESGDPIAAANEAKANNIQLITIAYGSGADTSTLESMASTPARDNAYRGDRRDIDDIFETISREICRNVLTIRSDTGRPTYYQFRVDGNLKRSSDNGATVDPSDLAIDQKGYGRVGGGTDSYRYTGELTAFDVRGGSATITVNGSEVGRDELPAGPSPTESHPNVITISGGGSDDPIDYKFRVTGDVDYSRANGGSVGPDDLIVGDTVYGRIHGDVDSYQYSGTLVGFDSNEGDVSVDVTGEQVDPDRLRELPVRGRSLPNLLTIEGRDPSEVRYYQFTVSGDLAHSADTPSSVSPDATIDPEDLVLGDTGYGRATDGTDSYRFSGRIGAFDMDDGPQRILVNGNEVADPTGAPADAGSPSTPTPSTPGTPSGPGTTTTPGSGTETETGTRSRLTIRGTGEFANYAFTVSGDLMVDQERGGLERWDSISGSAADGWVTDPQHVDSFLFSGSIVDFEFKTGSARVILDGREVDPGTLG